MPITPTYPGVYIEEIPSGVRTITGVSTSVTAFIGSAKRGPIDKAVRVLGFADFERRFGGLSRTSDMTYAVRQFFNNGGSEAWIVRVAKSAVAAFRDLKVAANPSMTITAKDAGAAGNDIRVLVDHNGGSNFNLTIIYAPPGDPSAAVTERFENLSMNSRDAGWVENVVNKGSNLVTVKRTGTIPNTKATSTSGVLADADMAKVDATHNQMRISFDGGDPVTI
ncbi:MAG: phage tail protein, partial [Thermoanaerobaculia bacterium]